MLKLRGHHLLCLHGFSGMGYSSDFIENMTGAAKAFFSAEPVEVELVAGVDDICRSCPHMHEEGCWRGADADKVLCAQDGAVLGRLGLAPGDRRTSHELRRLVSDRIRPGDLTDICGGCEWLDFGGCRKGLEEKRL